MGGLTGAAQWEPRGCKVSGKGVGKGTEHQITFYMSVLHSKTRPRWFSNLQRGILLGIWLDDVETERIKSMDGTTCSAKPGASGPPVAGVWPETHALVTVQKARDQARAGEHKNRAERGRMEKWTLGKVSDNAIILRGVIISP